LGSFTRRYCPGTKIIPIIFGTMGIDTLTLPRIDASSAYRKDFVSITERESFWTRFRYTLGKRIKEEHAAEERAAKAVRKDDEGR
jgi:hypothetical protein